MNPILYSFSTYGDAVKFIYYFCIKLSPLDWFVLRKHYMIHYQDGLQDKWMLQGRFHNEEGPALITYYFNMRDISNIMYYNHGKLHRLDGVASIGFYRDGKKHYEDWRVNGLRHRSGDLSKGPLDLPANIEYYSDGKISLEGYWINGRRHREDGPASIHYNESGNIVWAAWYKDGVQTRNEGYRELELVILNDNPV